MRLNFNEVHSFWTSGRPDIPPYPMVSVRLSAKPGRYVDTYALLDSGADFTLFHAKWAKRLGLVLTRGRKDTVSGITGATPCYFHNIVVSIGSHSVPCEVAFAAGISDEMTSQLVGRDAIFDQLRFAFRQSVMTLYVGSTP